jgi:hypothetical protein
MPEPAPSSRATQQPPEPQKHCCIYPLQKVNVYYSFGQKCIQGIKVTYGEPGLRCDWDDLCGGYVEL